MKKSLLSLILFFVFIHSASAITPVNLSCAKKNIIQYYESGQYEKDVTDIIKDAEAYLIKRVQENNSSRTPSKLAMVLDIDDTSISHYKLNKRNDFSLTDLADVINTETKSPAIKPVLALYNEAIAKGLAVFFISARSDEARTNVITNLQNSGYAGWTEIYLPKGDEYDLPSQVYKTAVRKKLTDQGYTIILNLGDQDSDLAGGYAEHTDKIPNPMYTSSASCSSENKTEV